MFKTKYHVLHETFMKSKSQFNKEKKMTKAIELRKYRRG